MESSRISYLISQLVANQLSTAEKEEWQQYLQQADPELLAAQWASLVPDEPVAAFDESLISIVQQVVTIDKPGSVKKANRRLLPARWLVAAAILVMTAVGGWLWKQASGPIKTVKTSELNKQALPGTKGAILKLDNGTIIELDSVRAGVIAVQGTLSIVKKADGSIAYEGQVGNTVLYNQVITRQGQEIALQLPDGTSATLNAASSIRYPLQFAAKERLVEMTGEAYYQVVRDRLHPFRVSVKGVVIEDLGTAFNVNAYDDEAVLTTTLVEGAARVSDGSAQVFLKPGQQAVSGKSGGLKVMNADISENTAWLRGYFQFNDADLPTVLRQLARWYQLEIRYEGAVPNRSFGGAIERNLPLTEVLTILKRNNVKYILEENRLTVLP